MIAAVMLAAVSFAVLGGCFALVEAILCPEVAYYTVSEPSPVVETARPSPATPRKVAVKVSPVELAAALGLLGPVALSPLPPSRPAWVRHSVYVAEVACA